eukprot:3404372-Amphidinium_carterae.1
MRGLTFYSHLAGEEGSSQLPAQSSPSGAAEVGVLSGVGATGCDPDVRVDDPMDRTVPVVAEDPEVLAPTYNFRRIFVTALTGTWRNLGTIAKQPCKPKARRLKGYEGKAAHKQRGGALPAPPLGSRPRGRAPGPNKKARVTTASATPPSQPARGSETPLPFEQETATSEARGEEPGGSSCVDISEEPGGSSDVQAQMQCALCRSMFLELQLQERKIRSHWGALIGGPPRKRGRHFR